ncbi:MAG: hypothetical protein JNK72_15600 [Myxococcales bacterium]|nr:hypothetical protein [Myxococcales bacterium]
MIEWVELDITGFEVEDIEGARTAPGPCPACAKSLRLVERELVKNLRVFGLSLVAVERGGKVFQCPACEACFEPPAALPSEAPAAPSRSKVEGERAYLQRKIDEARDELERWRERRALAERRHDATLSREAQGLIERYAAVLETLEGELRHFDASPVGQAVPRDDQGLDEAIVALRQKSAERLAEAAPSPVERAPEAPKAPPPSRDDELAALKRRLGLAPVSAPAAPTVEREVAAPTPPPVQPPPVPDAPTGASPDADDEMAALKRRLRGK